MSRLRRPGGSLGQPPGRIPNNRKVHCHSQKKYAGPAEIWTRIAGFRVQSANHYTMGPDLAYGWHEGYPAQSSGTNDTQACAYFAFIFGFKL